MPNPDKSRENIKKATRTRRKNAACKLVSKLVEYLKQQDIANEVIMFSKESGIIIAEVDIASDSDAKTIMNPPVEKISPPEVIYDSTTANRIREKTQVAIAAKPETKQPTQNEPPVVELVKKWKW